MTFERRVAAESTKEADAVRESGHYSRGYGDNNTCDILRRIHAGSTLSVVNCMFGAALGPKRAGGRLRLQGRDGFLRGPAAAITSRSALQLFACQTKAFSGVYCKVGQACCSCIRKIYKLTTSSSQQGPVNKPPPLTGALHAAGSLSCAYSVGLSYRCQKAPANATSSN